MSILIPIAFLSILGLILAIGLVYASKKFSLEKDPKVEKVESALAGLNCGVCGYPGCERYAEAIVSGSEDIDKCAPGGLETINKVAEIMGVEIGELIPRVAVPQCQGGREQTYDKFTYHGVKDCRAAQMLGAGFKACSYGCLGLGSCAEACPFDAITMSENNLPVVDEEKCTACGVCVMICPRDIMKLIPRSQEVYLGCLNRGRGAEVKNICKVGCIACRLCVRKNPEGTEGIRMDGNLPVISYEKLTSWTEANEVCPQNCFVIRKPKERSEQSDESETPREKTPTEI
jgi:Na+-translocating ferredoxin:NAD+ oxidoreductase RNF subunit RnfB